MQTIKPITASDVVYLIMPDRFACSECACSEIDVDRQKESFWHGGNLRGIIEHLDYIANLGVTAIWLTPVMENLNPVENGVYTSYHGYGITDYKRVDPHFGTIEDYIELVNKAHSLGLKVVFDFVLNHCGIGNSWLKENPHWFNKLDSNKTPRITNSNVSTVFGAYSSKYDRESTTKGWFTPFMPDINLRNPEVLSSFKEIIDWWMDKCTIDAIRVDTYLYADCMAVMDWQKYVQNKYPGLSVIAETWGPNAAYIAEIQKRCNTNDDNRLIVMDFAFQKAIGKAFSPQKNLEQQRALYDHFINDFLYDDASHSLAFLDNHDLARWFYHHKNISQAKQAMGILLTIPRIPQILYGTEILLEGDGKGENDGNWRCDFPGGWNDDAINMFTPAGRQTTRKIADFWQFTQKLLKWRKISKAISEGSMTQFLPQNGVYVYARYTESDKVAILVNLSGANQEIDINRYREIIPETFVGRDLVTDKELTFNSNKFRIKKNAIIIAEAYV